VRRALEVALADPAQLAERGGAGGDRPTRGAADVRGACRESEHGGAVVGRVCGGGGAAGPRAV